MLLNSIYIFLIWLYSHKLKKFPFIGNLVAALLAVLPFFGVLMYYKNFYDVIFAHAIFLYLLILIREFVKDLENIEGDLVVDYKTIPVLFGENAAKYTISFLTLSSIVPVYFLIDVFDVGYMDIYFYTSYLILIFFLLKLWKSKTKQEFVKLHFLIKLIIVAGVFCIVLIEPQVLLHGKKLISTY